MTTLIFDTHEFVKKLVAAGMPEQQAEVIAHQQAKTIDENLATKQDLELLRKDLTLKLGTLIVSGFIATIGILIAVMQMMINNINL